MVVSLLMMFSEIVEIERRELVSTHAKMLERTLQNLAKF